MKIVVLTSNGYHRCLPPFAALFNRFWSPNVPVEVACYDAPLPELPANFSAWRIGQQADYTWSAGLLKYLEGVSDRVILLMLEDYFLSAEVAAEKIVALHTLINNAETVAKIDLCGQHTSYPHRDGGEWSGIDLVVAAREMQFLCSTQAAFWRTDVLRRFLDPDENAWAFEKNGSKRMRAAWDAGETLGDVIGTRQPIMRYVNAVGGMGNKPGQWDYKKIPLWMREELGLTND